MKILFTVITTLALTLAGPIQTGGFGAGNHAPQGNVFNSAESGKTGWEKIDADTIRKLPEGYPVYGPLNDTLFMIYAKLGASGAKERALNISKKIKRLYSDNFLKIDSIVQINSDDMIDIAYKDLVVMSISPKDALLNNRTESALAKEYCQKIKDAITYARRQESFTKLLLRTGFVILILAGIWLMIRLIIKAYKSLKDLLPVKKEKLFKDISYKGYTFLTIGQELEMTYFLLKVLKWFLIILLVYLLLPLIFSIFPFTHSLANTLFDLIWDPFKSIFIAIWSYLPNVFTILVIYFVIKYFIRLVRYIFQEIGSEKLKISGFYPEWAMPTFNIVRFFLYAFMFVLIFPYLPGSDSDIFKGVSVFLGILFSLGSSSAIANMIAGLVITYMRPFKIGDRIKIGELTGDVIEKTMLVTRLRTIKNEEITIPNSAILSGNTINYSTFSKNGGLIIHSTVTIGYNVPWKDMHQALIDAALRTKKVLSKPQPFVLQTNLNDFYVSYQINAYTDEASQQSFIYSELHQNIQDVCFERGIEILSPHYHAARDGNATAIPNQYLPPDYSSPGFKINMEKNNKT